MTRAYALMRLLEHGPMIWPELLSCTGWSRTSLHSVICNLADGGVVVRQNRRGGFVYGLASPGRGSFPEGSDAGNSRPGLGLFHGAPKGVK